MSQGRTKKSFQELLDEVIESFKQVDDDDLPDLITLVYNGVRVDITEEVYSTRV